MDENANSENNGACSEYLFMRGYNCAQAVFAAHATKLGMDFDTALKVSAPLGGGVGRMREGLSAPAPCSTGLKTALPTLPLRKRKRPTQEFKNSLRFLKSATAQ